MNLDHFGMDTITLAGPLEAKLAAMRGAGFTQVMLMAPDIAGHPAGEQAAVAAVRASGLRDRKSTRLNSSHIQKSRMPSSA